MYQYGNRSAGNSQVRNPFLIVYMEGLLVHRFTVVRSKGIRIAALLLAAYTRAARDLLIALDSSRFASLATCPRFPGAQPRHDVRSSAGVHRVVAGVGIMELSNLE